MEDVVSCEQVAGIVKGHAPIDLDDKLHPRIAHLPKVQPYRREEAQVSRFQVQFKVDTITLSMPHLRFCISSPFTLF